MNYTVEASITPKAAAKLLISGEIDLTRSLSSEVTQKIFDNLLEMSIQEILQIVDCNSYGEIAEIKYIPQFGKIDTVIAVPSYFVNKGLSSTDYAQLGFYLKNDVQSSLVANVKFGENHGKAAAILGLAKCENKRIFTSSISAEFCLLDNEKKQEIAKRLLFRVPIVQIILRSAQNNTVNGYAPMEQMKNSTMCRRGQCLRGIFKWMRTYNNEKLNSRINNIYWDNNGGDYNVEV